MCSPAAAVITADAAGMPYYDTVGALEIAEQMLRPWCEARRRRGIRCDALVREGHPTQQIAAAVRQFQADRVLLGTRSRSKLGKLLLGSVAEQVLRSVYLPVITVGPEAHLPVDKGEERVVLHATTLRETSRPSAALACQIASTQKCKVDSAPRASAHSQRWSAKACPPGLTRPPWSNYASLPRNRRRLLLRR